jgi:hypothetical protein
MLHSTGIAILPGCRTPFKTPKSAFHLIVPLTASTPNMFLHPAHCAKLIRSPYLTLYGGAASGSYQCTRSYDAKMRGICQLTMRTASHQRPQKTRLPLFSCWGNFGGSKTHDFPVLSFRTSSLHCPAHRGANLSYSFTLVLYSSSAAPPAIFCHCSLEISLEMTRTVGWQISKQITSNL